MKVLTQNFKNGELSVDEYPFPAVPPNGALVATTFSAVSLGTERAVYQLARANPLQKVRTRPDLVRQVWNRAKNDGLLNTISVVRNLVSSPVPLGYSLCGVVLKTGYRCDHVQPGDRVACGGFEYANHAEINAVPRNMIVKVPDGVTDEEAAFATIASVPLHALRLCDIKAGDCVLIVGMGLLGHLCAAMAEAQGAVVTGYDPAARQIDSARSYVPSGRFFSERDGLTAATTAHGRGYDHTLICASGGDAKLFTLAGELTRDRGEIVVVGDVQCELPRRLYYEKELAVKFARAYGPGRYDESYEKQGIDYPYAYVRWTMQRNMEEVLRLLAGGKFSVSPLITHRLLIDTADQDLESLFRGDAGPAMGIVIGCPASRDIQPVPVPLRPAGAKRSDAAGLRVGLIGAGRFAQGVLIPAFRKAGITEFKRIATGRGLSAVSAGRKFGAEEAVSSVEEVIGDPHCNALLISTNHDQHADLICRGLEAGKHVFCEKPLCVKREDLSRIVAAERASTAVLMVGFNRRFSPFLTKLREAVSFSSEPATLLYRINAGAQPPDAWVHDEYAGGGRIVGEVCHYIDVANFLLDSPVRFVQACSTTGDRDDRTYYDTVTLTLKYQNGSTATILFVANGNTSFPKEYLEVHRAGASGFLHNYRKLVFQGGKRSVRYRTFSQQKGFVEEARAFAEACRTGQAPISMDAMAETTLVTFAAMASLESGSPIDMAGLVAEPAQPSQ